MVMSLLAGQERIVYCELGSMPMWKLKAVDVALKNVSLD